MLRLTMCIFTWLHDDTRHLSDHYLRQVLRWGAWSLTDPELFTRSLLGAGEMAFVALAVPAFSGLAPVPDEIAELLEDAVMREEENPWGARAQAVDALDRTVAHYAGLPAEAIDPRIVAWLPGIRRIAEWNREPAATPPHDGGSGASGGGASAGGSGAPGVSGKRTRASGAVSALSFGGIDDGTEDATPVPEGDADAVDTTADASAAWCFGAAAAGPFPLAPTAASSTVPGM